MLLSLQKWFLWQKSAQIQTTISFLLGGKTPKWHKFNSTPFNCGRFLAADPTHIRGKCRRPCVTLYLIHLFIHVCFGCINVCDGDRLTSVGGGGSIGHPRVIWGWGGVPVHHVLCCALCVYCMFCTLLGFIPTLVCFVLAYLCPNVVINKRSSAIYFVKPSSVLTEGSNFMHC